MQKSVDGLLKDDYNLTNLIMQSPVAMALLYGENHIIQLVNVKSLEILGHEWHILRDRPLFDALPEIRNQGLESVLEEVYTTGIPYTANELMLNMLHDEKTVTKYLNVTFQPLRNEYHHVIGIVATGVDMTEQVISNRLIKESESKYKGLFHSMTQGFCIIKMVFDENNNPVDFVFTEVNSAFYNITPHRDVVGKSARSLIKGNFDFWLDVYGKVVLTGQEVVVSGKGISDKGQHFEVYAYPVGCNQVAVLFSDVSERKKSEEMQKLFAEKLKALVEQRTMELQQSNENLQQFAHIASHDLKEPVRKITSYAGLLLNDELSEEEKLTFIRNIHKSGLRMAKTIDDILNYSTSDRYFDHEFDEVNLNEVISDVRLDLEMNISNKKAVIEVGELPVLKCSRILMYQLFYNLLANALKFSKPCVPAKISIASKPIIIDDKEYAEITVTDNGVGFDMQFAEKIFEKFSRLHSKDRYEGTGLGLALCKRIVERHSGIISATSLPDEGAAFIVALPV
jgi:signal transduction histidine kinase